MSPLAPPFDKKEVRQAVGYAIDRDTIIKRVLQGQATKINGPVGPGQVGYAPSIDYYVVTRYADVLAHVNVSAYYGYGTAGVAPLLPVVERLGRISAAHRVRVALVVRNLDSAPATDVEAVTRACRDAGLPRHRDLDEAAVAIAAAQRFARARGGR